jgi:hypothetical protein
MAIFLSEMRLNYTHKMLAVFGSKSVIISSDWDSLIGPGRFYRKQYNQWITLKILVLSSVPISNFHKK